jgi:hypothetical protein
MFKCDECGDVQKPQTHENKFVSKKRQRIYEEKIVDKNGYTQFKHSKGWEIAKELRLCATCHSIRKGSATYVQERNDGRTNSGTTGSSLRQRQSDVGWKRTGASGRPSAEEFAKRLR